jgi:hypothetical protein
MAPLSNARSTLPAAAPTRVRLAPTRSRRMILDGCWWPASTDPVAELPALIRALDKRFGPVTRVLLSAAGWSRRPHRVEVAGRLVSLGYFADQPATLLTAICPDGDRISIQIIPPAPQDPDSAQDGRTAVAPLVC